ncbi:unnamed protein product [Leptidea sinapis]|uniref:Uncharacterized protein n=1 Tax=Leptidea sinapis TaxID=189913 RepID=A0A5E4Q7V7_9NEOP|nr:unnamed protein product [Leptidea sinapis]
MAALSCYQPCRSHLAQPVRDLLAEVSVKRTREELAKHACQTIPLTRRLNVESGWSKVEEVRKKFEGAVTASSYSRSFESPPRRRLADSLFASFKLPRKKEMATPRSLPPQPQQKRKSAVELLAETKAFYVKSETVLDRKQELPLRVNATTRLRDKSRVNTNEGLQNTLRRLLEHSDSRENVYSPPFATKKSYTEIRRIKDSYPDRELPRSQHTSGTFSGTSSSGTSGSKHKHEEKRALSYGDARVFFPESFVIPRQRASEVIIKNTYSIPSPQSSPQNPDLSPSGDQLDAISPPAEYAHSAPRYIRSNSHSQPSVREEDGNTNINSHKSLPDLHAQAHVYPEHVNVVIGSESIGRSPRRRRHSHHRTASCSSKGTRQAFYLLLTYTVTWAVAHESLLWSNATFQRPPSSRTASAPPPQFQDEPPLYDYGDYDCSYKTPLKCLNVGRKEYTATREYTRYRRTDGRSPASAPCEGEDSPDSPSEESARLQLFFDRLGLESRTYEAIIRDDDPDSPVFFSSASTVDSNQLATTDYTKTSNRLFLS